MKDSVNNLLEGVNGAAHNLIYTVAPTENYDNVDNTASRLLRTIASASDGLLREASKELNSSTTEVQVLQQSVLDNLNVTNNSNMIRMFYSFVENVPRATLQSSGILSAVPQIGNSYNDLARIYNTTQLQPLTATLEDFSMNLALNFRSMSNLRDLPKSLIHLEERLASGRERIVILAQSLNASNETQVDSVSTLINSVDILINSVPVILQSVQNVLSNTRLNLENYSSSVITQIQSIIRKQLDELPAFLIDATKSLDELTQTITKDMEEALEYNQLAVDQSIQSADQLIGVAGNAIDLLIKQIQSSLSSMHKSAVPTVGIIVTQLKTLLKATETAIRHSITTSSNNLFTSFDGVLATIESHLIKGSLSSEDCVNSTIKGVDNICDMTMQALVNCASFNVVDMEKFTNQMLDDTDELLVDASKLADQLDVCSRGFNATGNNYAVYRLNSCLQSVLANQRKNVVLNHLSNIQVEITNAINTIHKTIHSCVYQGLYDADNAAVVLDRATEKCFRNGK